MKKFIFLIVFGCMLLSVGIAYGQGVNMDHNNGQIGITFSSFGKSSFAGSGLLCDCTYHVDHYFNIGIMYSHPVNGWLDIETGIEYSKQVTQNASILPGVPHYTSTSSFALLDIPLTVRAHFLRYLFVQGGFLVDIDMDQSDYYNLTGIGEILGGGVQYDFKQGISVFINPYVKFHSTIHFTPEHHVSLIESGIRFGVAFNL